MLEVSYFQIKSNASYVKDEKDWMMIRKRSIVHWDYFSSLNNDQFNHINIEIALIVWNHSQSKGIARMKSKGFIIRAF